MSVWPIIKMKWSYHSDFHKPLTPLNPGIGPAILETRFSEPGNFEPGSGPAISSPGFFSPAVLSPEPGPDRFRCFFCILYSKFNHKYEPSLKITSPENFRKFISQEQHIRIPTCSAKNFWNRGSFSDSR